MSDPAVKTAMALCVIMLGVCAALLFRRDRPQTAPAGASAEEQLLLRFRNEASNRSRTGRRSASSPAAAAAAAPSRPATIVTPLDCREPPPSLPQEYPEPTGAPGARWGTSMEMMLPIATADEDATRAHTIVDGDTLASLAQRYLGSAVRADEIYQANRQVLAAPNLLPIGVELKIPPRNSRPSPPPPGR